MYSFIHGAIYSVTLVAKYWSYYHFQMPDLSPCASPTQVKFIILHQD